ncbi:hypothetical protein HDU83_007819 [Entophlyctis luteolus]|nr:hypothetical protein HDU83_007819 [Entophlyctis luteolus]
MLVVPLSDGRAAMHPAGPELVLDTNAPTVCVWRPADPLRSAPASDNMLSSAPMLWLRNLSHLAHAVESLIDSGGSLLQTLVDVPPAARMATFLSFVENALKLNKPNVQFETKLAKSARLSEIPYDVTLQRGGKHRIENGYHLRFDPYICGHPAGRSHKFRSYNEMKPHVLFLLYGHYATSEQPFPETPGEWEARDVALCQCDYCPTYISRFKNDIYIPLTRPMVLGINGTPRYDLKAPNAVFRVGEHVWARVILDGDPGAGRVIKPAPSVFGLLTKSLADKRGFNVNLDRSARGTASYWPAIILSRSLAPDHAMNVLIQSVSRKQITDGNSLSESDPVPAENTASDEFAFCVNYRVRLLGFDESVDEDIYVLRDMTAGSIEPFLEQRVKTDNLVLHQDMSPENVEFFSNSFLKAINSIQEVSQRWSPEGYSGILFGAELLRIGDIIRLIPEDENDIQENCLIIQGFDFTDSSAVVVGHRWEPDPAFCISMLDMKTRMPSWKMIDDSRWTFGTTAVRVPLENIAGRLYPVNMPGTRTDSFIASSYWYDWNNINSNHRYMPVSVKVAHRTTIVTHDDSDITSMASTKSLRWHATIPLKSIKDVADSTADFWKSQRLFSLSESEAKTPHREITKVHSIGNVEKPSLLPKRKAAVDSSRERNEDHVSEVPVLQENPIVSVKRVKPSESLLLSDDEPLIWSSKVRNSTKPLDLNSVSSDVFENPTDSPSLRVPDGAVNSSDQQKDYSHTAAQNKRKRVITDSDSSSDEFEIELILSDSDSIEDGRDAAETSMLATTPQRCKLYIGRYQKKLLGDRPAWSLMFLLESFESVTKNGALDLSSDIYKSSLTAESQKSDMETIVDRDWRDRFYFAKKKYAPGGTNAKFVDVLLYVAKLKEAENLIEVDGKLCYGTKTLRPQQPMKEQPPARVRELPLVPKPNIMARIALPNPGLPQQKKLPSVPRQNQRPEVFGQKGTSSAMLLPPNIDIVTSLETSVVSAKIKEVIQDEKIRKAKITELPRKITELPDNSEPAPENAADKPGSFLCGIEGCERTYPTEERLKTHREAKQITCRIPGCSFTCHRSATQTMHLKDAHGMVARGGLQNHTQLNGVSSLVAPAVPTSNVDVSKEQNDARPTEKSSGFTAEIRPASRRERRFSQDEEKRAQIVIVEKPPTIVRQASSSKTTQQISRAVSPKPQIGKQNNDKISNSTNRPHIMIVEKSSASPIFVGNNSVEHTIPRDRVSKENGRAPSGLRSIPANSNQHDSPTTLLPVSVNLLLDSNALSGTTVVGKKPLVPDTPPDSLAVNVPDFSLESGLKDYAKRNEHRDVFFQPVVERQPPEESLMQNRGTAAAKISFLEYNTSRKHPDSGDKRSATPAGDDGNGNQATKFDTQQSNIWRETLGQRQSVAAAVHETEAVRGTNIYEVPSAVLPQAVSLDSLPPVASSQAQFVCKVEDPVSVAYDATYDEGDTKLTSLACSDGNNGLMTKLSGATTLQQVPGFPNIAAVGTVAGWNSPNCGACYTVTYNGVSVTVVAADAAKPGTVVMSVAAMNVLTSGQAVFLGRVSAELAPAASCGI